MENPTVLSVIIPTLNEAANLARTLAHTRVAAARETIELIVSDCRSDDQTPRIAAEHGARVIEDSLSRSQALNRGAEAARGSCCCSCTLTRFFHRLRRRGAASRWTGQSKSAARLAFAFCGHPGCRCCTGKCWNRGADE